MKNLFVFLIVLVSCNNQPKKEAQQHATVPDSTNMKVQIPEAHCYLYVSGKDTVALKLEPFPNVVTGVLRYDYFGVDGSTGTFDGKLQGDTLVGYYDFMAEGTRSIRQVVFVVKDDIAREGFGDMEEKDGKLVFKDISKADFSKSVPLRKISCQDYDPALELR